MTCIRRHRPGYSKVSLLLAWVATLLLTTSLVWAISWFRPAKHTGVLLVGAGYETDLALPHNAYGWNSLEQVWNRVDPNHNPDSLLRGLSPPQRLGPDFQWQPLVAQSSDNTLLLYISAHGSADHKGTYLFGERAADQHDLPSSTERLHLDELFDSLASLPAEQHKLVCFDATQVFSAPRSGVLVNEFVRGMLELEDRIAKIPNLVVICSSDVNQVSWTNDAWRTSVFGHFFLAGLRGEVVDDNNNGRICVSELFNQVHLQTAHWSRRHRGVEQTPLLLPTGAEGLRRAQSIEFDTAHRNGKPMATTPSPENPQRVVEAWRHFDQFQQQAPHVYRYAPADWREYVDTLIRCEELVRAGDNEAAETMFQRLETIEYRALRESIHLQHSIENSLATHTLVRDGRPPIDAGQQMLDQLWNAKPEETLSLWEAKLKQLDDDPLRRELLRVAVFQALIQRVIDDPAAHLPRGADLVRVLRSPMHPLPAEIHFLSMLAKHLPPEALSDSAPLIASALKVRCLAERAAVGDVNSESRFGESLFPWFEASLQQADGQRRQGEDLLFGDSAARKSAAACFANARQGYKNALAQAAKARAALETRDQAFALLPYYTEWLSAQALDRNLVDARFADEINQIAELWQKVHQLDAMLAAPDPRFVADPNQASSNPEAAGGLVELQQSVESGLDSIAKQFATEANQLATGDAQSHPRSIRLALRVPTLDLDMRAQLIKHLIEAASAEAVDTLAGTRAHATATRTTSAETAKAWDTLAKTSAVQQGRLALATLGRAAYSRSHRVDAETFDQTSHRLELLEVEQQWWKASAIVGEQLAIRYDGFPTMIRAALERATGGASPETCADLRSADTWGRLLDGAQAGQVPNKPAAALRRCELHRLAVDLADRTAADHWYALDPSGEPYFIRAAMAYTNDAARMFPPAAEDAPAGDRFSHAAPFQIADIPPIQWTTQTRLQLRYRLTADSGAKAPTGFPVSWLECGDGIQLIEPLAGQRFIRRVPGTDGGEVIPFDLESSLFDQAERAGFPAAKAVNTEIMLNVFHRGRKLEKRVPVVIHRQPEVLINDHPLPNQAALSVTASPEIQRRYGAGSGSVAFVLDCSGSMGPADENAPDKSKYAEAVSALEQILYGVPKGTRVSLWTFGEAIGPQRTVLAAEKTIRQVLPPVAWNPDDASQLQHLIDEISPSRVTPWNQSPILRAVLAAKEDVQTATGYRTIVVITDGMDNRFADDPSANPAGLTIPQAIASSFDGSGISVNVIGFKVEGPEEAELLRQFAAVGQLTTPGRLELVSHVDALAASLDNALRTNLQFHLNAYDGQPSPPPNEIGRSDAVVWPTTPYVPGTYRLQMKTDRPIEADVTLRGGDVLALTLQQGDQGLELRQQSFAKSALPHRPTAENDHWKAVLMQNQLAANGGYRAVLGLESASAAGSVFTQVTPSTIWFDLEPNATSKTNICRRWSRQLGYPLPSWNLTATDWPQAVAGNKPSAAKIGLWWNTEEPDAFVASVRRNKNRPAIADLAGTLIHGVESSVAIESVAIEPHWVETKPGHREQRSCLVVRLQHPANEVYWCRLIGLEAAGCEQRYYPSVGAYTAMYWPVTEEVASRALAGIGVVSLESFRKNAELRGEHLQFENVGPTEAGQILPTPSYLFP